MIFVPLPFVVALLILLLAVVVLRREDVTPWRRPFLILVLVCATQAILIGLRWGYDFRPAQLVIPVLAATIPPLVYTAALRLSGGPRWRLAIHALPAAAMVILVALRSEAIDAALMVISGAYALAMIRLIWAGPDALGAVALEGAQPIHRALGFATASLCAAVLVDAIVLYDFAFSGGAHAGVILGMVPLLSLALLCVAAGTVLKEPSAAPTATDKAPLPNDLEDASATLTTIEGLMREQKLFRDENLTLDRLARKAGVPARRISAAVNQATGKNVSQWVNEFRVQEACRLLRETEQSVTAVMFESGFQTKSNFNREFRRVTGLSPQAWRSAGKSQD